MTSLFVVVAGTADTQPKCCLTRHPSEKFQIGCNFTVKVQRCFKLSRIMTTDHWTFQVIPQGDEHVFIAGDAA